MNERASVEKYIEIITSNLANQSVELKELVKVKQTVRQRKEGFVTVGGILVPQSAVEHRILVDEFPVVFFSAVSLLYKQIYEKRREMFTSFANRTCMELCMERALIIFDIGNIPEDQRRLYILSLMVDDYAFMSLGNSEYKDFYGKLLKEEDFPNIFKEYIEKITKSIESGDQNQLDTNLRKFRNRVSNLQGQLVSKVQLPIDFVNTRLKGVEMSFSHVLHGNAFLLAEQLKGTDAGYRWSTYTLTVLLMAGATLVNIVEKYLNSKGKYTADLDEFNKDTLAMYDALAKDYLKNRDKHDGLV